MRMLMRQVTRAALLLPAAILVACSGGTSQGAFAQAINAEIGKERLCWALENMGNARFPINLNVYFSKPDSPILDGLYKAGYITVERGDEDHFGNLKSIRIDLTDKGKSANVWDPQQGFCVGQRRVHEITQWTEPAANQGILVTQISYTWVLSERPRWVTDEHFGQIEGIKEPVQGVAVAQKTNKGWQVVLN